MLKSNFLETSMKIHRKKSLNISNLPLVLQKIKLFSIWIKATNLQVNFVKEFFIGGQEVGKIIPFSVLII